MKKLYILSTLFPTGAGFWAKWPNVVARIMEARLIASLLQSLVLWHPIQTSLCVCKYCDCTLRKPKLLKGSGFVGYKSQNFLDEILLYPTKAISCEGRCFCILQKHKLVKKNTFVGYRGTKLVVGDMFVSSITFHFFIR